MNIRETPADGYRMRCWEVTTGAKKAYLEPAFEWTPGESTNFPDYTRLIPDELVAFTIDAEAARKMMRANDKLRIEANRGKRPADKQGGVLRFRSAGGSLWGDCAVRRLYTHADGGDDPVARTHRIGRNPKGARINVWLDTQFAAPAFRDLTGDVTIEWSANMQAVRISDRPQRWELIMPIVHKSDEKPVKPVKPATARQVARLLSRYVDATPAQILAVDQVLVSQFPNAYYRRARLVMAAAIATTTDARPLKTFILDVNESLPDWFEADTGKKLDI